MWHIHHASHSRDCDGPFETYHDYVPDPTVQLMQNVDPTDSMDLAMFYVMPLLFQSPDPEIGPVDIRIALDGQGRYVMSSSRDTDEGYSSEQYVVCDCGDFEPSRSQRDHFAEAAGY